ncbi:MAG: hypothetical protein AAGA30_12575, partial [Planctomycetota bacterium]
RSRHFLAYSLVTLALLPLAILYADVVHRLPKPVNARTGPNGIDELIAIGNKIGDAVDRSNPRVPLQGAPLMPFPVEQKKLKKIVRTYSSQLAEAREVLGRPTSLRVNYDWHYDGGFRNRCPHRNVLVALNIILTAEIRLALADKDFDQAIESYRDGLAFNKMCGNGGLLLDRDLAVRQDIDLTKELFAFRDQLSVEQLNVICQSIANRHNDYEPVSDVMSRRLIWEDRVARWNERLWLRYLSWLEKSPTDVRMRKENWAQRIRDLYGIQLAVLKYQKTMENSPKSLQELVPDYVDQIPANAYVHRQEVKYMVNEYQFDANILDRFDLVR